MDKEGERQRKQSAFELALQLQSSEASYRFVPIKICFLPENTSKLKSSVRRWFFFESGQFEFIKASIYVHTRKSSFYH